MSDETDGAGEPPEQPTDPVAEDSPSVATHSVFVTAPFTPRDDPGVGLRGPGSEPGPPRTPVGPEKYQVLDLIGRGGMGSVYLVYDRDLKRTTALKMSQRADPESNRRFFEEAQIMGQLQHPNIVPVHELGVADGERPYYTMPEVRGLTLAEIISGLQRDDPELGRTYGLTRLIQILIQVTYALDYAHAKGVVHRDVKPANIMVGQHGEVQVLDWGMSQIPTASDVARGGAGAPDGRRAGGTPQYMSPEQAAGGAVDAGSDIYALGVVLFEILTLERPFSATGAELLRAHVETPPPRPSEVAPGRLIPSALERTSLRAMAKAPGDRQGSMRELGDEVQAWLEAETDRAARRDQAEEKARAGASELASYFELARELEVGEAECDELRGRFQSYDPVEVKRPLFARQRRLAEDRAELVRRRSRAVNTLSEALGFDRDNATARAALADYYIDRFRLAEAEGDPQSAFYQALVSTYDDGRHARELSGEGSVELASEPGGAEVWLHELVETDLQLRPGAGRRLGVTPLGPLPLAMGRYVVELRSVGHRSVRYPIFITRNREWVGRVHLFRDDDIADGFVQVPAGPFLWGGDTRFQEFCAPRAEVELDDFFIARHPVTMSEYLVFLNELASDDLDRALARSPRGPRGESYLERTPDGLLRLPEVDAQGDAWDPRIPAVAVSWHDAAAYAEWLGARTGYDLRLPTDEEWEKAARGVDGRSYPWGDEIDPSLCNTIDSRKGAPVLAPVDDFETDVSVYGVRGMAGNASDWTATAGRFDTGQEGEEDARPLRITHGGSWLKVPAMARCVVRSRHEPELVDPGLAFRLAYTPRSRR